MTLDNPPPPPGENQVRIDVYIWSVSSKEYNKEVNTKEPVHICKLLSSSASKILDHMEMHPRSAPFLFVP
jgi:hypothetical protein